MFFYTRGCCYAQKAIPFQTTTATVCKVETRFQETFYTNAIRTSSVWRIFMQAIMIQILNFNYLIFNI